MGRIRVLDDLVSNQIAAGEVVERPASAVKELVENAIDAGATHISVRITEGGLGTIDVQDNGCGMEAEDVEIAFLRHATSKLSQIDDLRRLTSLGFRGEALPSICSVSRVVLRTRTPNAEAGLEVCFEAGSLMEKLPAGCPVGTRVVVSDLFYNTPARLKFVRSLQTEASHVVDVVSRAAMARPDIAFQAFVDGKIQLSTVGNGQLSAAYRAVFGDQPAKDALAVLLEHPDYSLEGLISAPLHTRTSRNHMWFSINGRPVRSMALANAVMDGYYTALPKGRYPLVALSLKMDPALVDVNVHPAKLEVRFSEERELRDVVQKAVWAALRAGGQVHDAAGILPPPGNLQTSGAAAPLPGAPKGTLQSTASPLLNTSQGVAQNTPSPLRSPAMSAAPFSTSHPREISRSSSRSGAIVHEPDLRAVQVALDIQQPVADGTSAASSYMGGGLEDQASATPSDGQGGVRDLRAVAQVLQMYIVAEDGETVYLIDQHAAHERVLYEKFRAEFRQKGVSSLPLLVPVTIEVRPQEVAVLEMLAGVAEKFGFQYELFGDAAFAIRAIPHIWEGLDIDRLARDVLSEFLEAFDDKGARDAMALSVAMEDRLIMRACKAAIKANQSLTQMEMDALMKALSRLENPFTCPHGRPTAIRMTRGQLERAFKRTM